MKYKPRKKVWESRNNSFNPETFEAYSYGWWMYVRKIKGTIVFNDYRYSVTTNKHQAEMWRLLIDTLKVKESEIVLVEQNASLSHGICLNGHYKKLFLAEFRLKAKGRKQAYYDGQRDTVDQCKREIKILRKLGAELYSYDGRGMFVADFKKQVIEAEKQRLEKQRKISRAQRERLKIVFNQFKSAIVSTQSISI